MIVRTKYFSTYRSFGFLALMCCAVLSARAQEGYEDIIARYKTENAVATITEHLTIRNEGGKLVASSDISKERLLISDLSPGLYNSESIYHSFFNQLDHFDAEALIPSDKGYRRKKDYMNKTRKSESENIFYDDSKQTEITFSGLTRYSVLKTNYTINHTDLHMLPSFYFQESMPAVKMVFMVTAPKYVQMKFVMKGTHTDWIKQTTEEGKNTITYTFTAEHVPALKTFDDLPSISYYMPHVLPFITSYKLPKDDQATPMLANPAELYAYYYNFIKDINTREDENLGKIALELTKDDKTDREKAAHIYQWVQKNIHYIAFEDSLGGFVPRQASDICRRKFGDCKDMASILTAMCRKVGLKAYFTWIGTRHRPYTYEETPLPIVDNHMICALQLGDEWLFLDGTDPLIPFGYNPSGIQGKEALIGIDKDHFKILVVPEAPAQLNMINDSTHIHIEGSGVAGRVTTQFKGYPAWMLQSALMYYKNEDRERYIKGVAQCGNNKFVQKSYTYTPMETGMKDAGITSDFTVDNYIQTVGKEHYVNMNLNRSFDNWVDVEDRNVAVSYKYKYKVTEVVTLDIPKGYKATYVPENASGRLDGLWSFDISYTALPDKVVLTKKYELNTLTLPVERFAENNKMVENLRKQYKESIVLTAN